MCSKDPHERATLSSIVYALEHLSIQERSGSSQPETEPPSCFDDYNSGTMIELWNTLQEYMEEGGNVEYRPAFDKLKQVHECLHESKQKPFLLKRFCSLLTDFDQTVRMPPERARIMRLSSTRATKTCPYALDWRIGALLEALGKSTSKATEPRWHQQRSDQIAAFVSGVSDTFLVLQGLKSMEERSAFLRLLKTEMENTQVEYTPEQLQTMKKAYEEITSRIETKGDLTTLTPDWFIPWYELIVDEWELLGRGGFGSVYRAKWLDSDVVVKQVILPGSTGSSKTVTWSEQRIKISTVVDELAKQVSNIDGNKPAKTVPTEIVAQKDLSKVLKSTQKLLGELRVNSERYDDSILSLYFVLWDHIKQVHGQIDGMEPIAGCWDAFQAFFSDARALTIKLQTMDKKLVSVTETTMCCYALRRRLNKLCDAYFLDCPNDPGFQATGLLVGLNTREAEGNEPPPSFGDNTMIIRQQERQKPPKKRHRLKQIYRRATNKLRLKQNSG
ncbi:hypothetical protein PRNP1_011253 [Phytophthora ramorum]